MEIEGDTVLGKSKLDHLQPCKVILSQNVSASMPFYWELPFLITPGQSMVNERTFHSLQNLASRWPGQANEELGT